jgi:primase-polymerase (primpol)-like protein
MLDSTKHFSGLPAALEPLAAENRWTLWKFEAVNDRRTKVPYAPSGLKAKTNDPTTWSSYADVIVAFNNGA